jgi:hypothetical protein
MKRFLFAAVVLNTGLFAAARVLEVSRWWVLAADVVLLGVWTAWRTWSDPAQQLANQAAYMDWVAAGIEHDEAGYRDTLLTKDGMVAKISWRRKHVMLVEPIMAGPFKDFVDLDRFLQAQAATGAP